MMARRGVLGVLVGGAVALLSGCGLSGNPSYRFKMTVEVDTPEGLKTGSSVYEVETTGSSDLMYGGKGSRFTFRGEAVAVDLPDGRTLFALLKTVAGAGHDVLPVSSMVAMDPDFDYDWMASTKRIASGDSIKSPAELPAGYYPMLVTFTDIDDPSSVQRVDPANLAASFGPGIRLKRITVEVTDDDVTTGIEKRLPSASNKGFFNWDGKSNPNDPGTFGIWDFIKGSRK